MLDPAHSQSVGRVRGVSESAHAAFERGGATRSRPSFAGIVRAGKTASTRKSRA